MQRRRVFLTLWIAMCVAALAFPACSGSGGKKKRHRTVLLTVFDDERVGAEASKSVAAQLGVLDDKDLNSYINEIGRKLLRGIPRRSFQYEFSVVDQFEPNAFALPGGYIFISRGLLALANSEDELACVIGHEIGHANRRHAALQQELAKRMNPIAMPWFRQGQMAAYGRDMEREADSDGQKLAAAAGYDPMGMSTFLNDLGQVERYMVGYSRQPFFLDTHPGANERAAANAARAHEIRWVRDPALGDTHRAHLIRVDGVQLGDRPEAGVFEGERFFHADLDFMLRFPEGWLTQNSNQAVGAVSPARDAAVFLTADVPPGDLREVTKAFLDKMQQEGNVSVKGVTAIKVGRLSGWRAEVEGGGMAAIMTFIPYKGSNWRFVAMAPASRMGRYQGRMLNTVRSFRPLSDEERGSITGTYLRVVEAQRGDTFVSLGQREGNAWDPSRTAVYNGTFSNRRFDGGELVKIARVERYGGSQGAVTR